MADWSFDYAAIEELVNHQVVQGDVDRRAEAGRAAATAVCPRSEDGRNGEAPGLLASTIRVEKQGPARWVIYGNDTNAWYAPLIEWGTRPHEIHRRPGGPRLHWVGPDGQHFFRERVFHPGTKAYRVMSGTAIQAARNA